MRLGPRPFRTPTSMGWIGFGSVAGQAEVLWFRHSGAVGRGGVRLRYPPIVTVAASIIFCLVNGLIVSLLVATPIEASVETRNSLGPEVLYIYAPGSFRSLRRPSFLSPFDIGSAYICSPNQFIFYVTPYSLRIIPDVLGVRVYVLPT
ncbi:hypothetical protein GALMADRAFT_1086099 [Galerina marginata CBS 339.88]|uniref:Uncharacterized protein n=1 Tax=Galerina marginata (strain CBS 339.88) TaxID=685588 RepID=A0A067SKY4_GALM3|nr:hypothetical protein GALMADRAFT_1086099 [Galerina marginata CBS 339.88]